jgi:hypothetical protein
MVLEHLGWLAEAGAFFKRFDPRRLGRAGRIAANLEAYQQLDAAWERIAHLRGENDQLRAERETARARVRELEAQSSATQSMRFARNAFWIGEGYAEENGPFCPTCWGTDRRAVRMVVSNRGAIQEHARCGHCETALWIKDPDEPPPDPPARPRRRPGGGWVRDY